MSQRRWILIVGLSIVFLLALLPQVLGALIQRPIGRLIDPQIGPPPARGVPEHLIWWGLLVGSLALGIGLGIWLQGLIPQERATIPTRLKLLLLIGMLSLAVYIVNFLLPFPLHQYYGFKDLNQAKIADLSAGAAIGITAATLALFLLYYLAYRACRGQRNRWLWTSVLIGALLFGIVNYFTLTTTSLDIYDYIARGRVTAIYRGNPYVEPPSSYSFDPMMSYASWDDSTSAYGPMWEVLSGLLSHFAGDHLLANALAQKGLAFASYLLCTLLIASILRRKAPDRALAGTLLFAWNPLILMEGVSNGHNDLVMVALILAAFWFISRIEPGDRTGRLLLGGLAILLVWLSILVKFIPILLLPLFFLYVLAKERNLWRWIGLALLLLLPIVLFTFLYYRPFWAWPEVMDPILRRTDMFRLTIPSVLRSLMIQNLDSLPFLQTIGNYVTNFRGLIAQFTAGLNPEAQPISIFPTGPVEVAETIASWPFLIAFAVTYLVLAIRAALTLYKKPKEQEHNANENRSWQLLVGASLGAFLLYLLLASLWFWPWYLIWPIALLALSDDERLFIPLTLAACAGELAYIALNFVWYWMGELTWDTLYAVERPATLLMVIPALVAYAILYFRRKRGE